MARLAAALGVVAFILLRPALGDTYCPVHGAAFPAPTNLSSNPVILAAAANLSAILDRVTRDEYQGIEYQANVSSSSIGLASIHDERDIFQHHHTAQLRNDSLGGTNNVTGDTMYRLASISKMFTVLALLMQDGKVCLEDPVTKYVPELAAAAARQKNGSSNGLYPLEEARWDEVTLHALASHLAGTPTDAPTDISFLLPEIRGLGLPPLNASDVSSCGLEPGRPVCSREELLSSLVRRRPVFAPYGAVAYNNAAFYILGMVIESVSNKTYDAVLEDQIFGPLGLTRTSVRKPEDNSVGIIPVGPDFWSYDLGAENPGGGLYSSTNDLLKLGRAILRGDLLGPTATRAWLKPAALTTSLEFAIGAPWEISRVRGLTPDDRVIDLYTKAGGLIQYTTLFVLVPDYGLVMTFLLAGPVPPALSGQLTSLVLGTMIPAIEQVAREQAMARYGGSYRSSGGSNHSISLVVDDGPGLKVDRWIINGVDLNQQLQSLPASANIPVAAGQLVFRLYPTGLESRDTTGANTTSSRRVGFRAVPQTESAKNSTTTTPTGDSVLRGQESTVCGTWASIDRLIYGLNSMDDIVLHLDASGRAEAIELRAWQLIMARQQGSRGYGYSRNATSS